MEDEANLLREELARMRRLISEFRDHELVARMEKLIKELQRRLDEIEKQEPRRAD